MTCDSDFTVEQVWRFPVKSLGGQPVPSSQVDIRGLRGVTARYQSEPAAGDIEPPVVVGPDGSVYPVGSGAADQFLRALTGLPQVEVCQESAISHFDEVPLSVIGTATVAWLQAELPEVEIDPRRFRANL